MLKICNNLTKKIFKTFHYYMEIYSYQKYPQFKATKIAHTRNNIGKITTSIEIYKLGREDHNFLNKLAKKINFNELFPKLDTYSIERWKHILEYCIKTALNPDNQTFLAVSDNKPCGILSYSNDRNSLYLDGICSIPIEKNKKVNFVGKTLFLQIFKDAKEKNCKSIILDAVNNGPFNVVKKYENLGFKKDRTTFPYTKMVCNKHKIAEQLKELPFIIDYIPHKEEEIVNLNKILD